MIRVLAAAFAVAVILSACSESKEDYNKRAAAFVDSVASEAKVNLTVAGTRVRVWTNAIFDKKKTDPLTGEATAEYVFDFNEALAEYNASPLVKAVKENRDAAKKSLDSLFGTLKEAPEASTGTMNAAKEVYATYLKSYKLAFDAEGSLQSYRDAVIETRSKLDEQLDAFKLESK